MSKGRPKKVLLPHNEFIDLEQKVNTAYNRFSVMRKLSFGKNNYGELLKKFKYTVFADEQNPNNILYVYYGAFYLLDKTSNEVDTLIKDIIIANRQMVNSPSASYIETTLHGVPAENLLMLCGQRLGNYYTKNNMAYDKVKEKYKLDIVSNPNKQAVEHPYHFRYDKLTFGNLHYVSGLFNMVSHIECGLPKDLNYVYESCFTFSHFDYVVIPELSTKNLPKVCCDIVDIKPFKNSVVEFYVDTKSYTGVCEFLKQYFNNQVIDSATWYNTHKIISCNVETLGFFDKPWTTI